MVSASDTVNYIYPLYNNCHYNAIFTTFVVCTTLPGLLAMLPLVWETLGLRKGLLILCLLVKFVLGLPREVKLPSKLLFDAGEREMLESEGRALQGLPRPKSHLPPEDPLSEPAVYL